MNSNSCRIGFFSIKSTIRHLFLFCEEPPKSPSLNPFKKNFSNQHKQVAKKKKTSAWKTKFAGVKNQKNYGMVFSIFLCIKIAKASFYKDLLLFYFSYE